MSQVCWHANQQGEYWIDVRLGSESLEMLIDTGLIDAHGDVGFSIDSSLYDMIRKSGGFVRHQSHARLMASGVNSITESGSLEAQLRDPNTGKAIGPIVPIQVFRGAPGVPDRVGLAFFHRLNGCRVVWDLDLRTWCIEYP